MKNDLLFRLIFGLLMSLLMSVLMTTWVTWLNLGLRPDFGARWMHALVMSWPPAFVIAFLFGPLLHRFTQRLVL